MKFIAKKIKYLILPAVLFLFLPVFVFSQRTVIDPDTGLPVPIYSGGVTDSSCTGGYSLIGDSFKCTVFHLINIINLIIPILFAGAFLVFFWGVSKFILNSNNAAEIANGKKYMLWGIAVLFVLVSLRAILSFVLGSFGLGNPGVLPTLPTNIQ